MRSRNRRAGQHHTASAAAALPPVAAATLLPAATAAGQPSPAVLPRRESHDGPLAFDLGNLTASDVSSLDPAAFAGGGTDAACHKLAQSIFQSLTARLFALPSEAAPVGRLCYRPLVWRCSGRHWRVRRRAPGPHRSGCFDDMVRLCNLAFHRG